MSPHDSSEINLQLLPELNTPLWRSLARNMRDRFHPGPQPPPDSTRPIQVGMLISDRLNVPWYRTVFTSIGDVLAPDTLPPLELQSHPEDVGELISDEVQRGWWTSLLRNMADNLAPEKLPPLHLSSAPVSPKGTSQYFMVPRWSSLIELPKVTSPDQASAASWTPAFVRPSTPARPLSPDGVTLPPPFAEDIERARRELRRAHLREACWISATAIQIAFLFVWIFVWK